MVQGGFLIYLHITFVNPMWRNDMNTGIKILKNW